MISDGTTFKLAAGKGYRKPGLCRYNGAVLSTNDLFVTVEVSRQVCQAQGLSLWAQNSKKAVQKRPFFEFWAPGLSPWAGHTCLQTRGLKMRKGHLSIFEL